MLDAFPQQIMQTSIDARSDSKLSGNNLLSHSLTQVKQPLTQQQQQSLSKALA